VLPDGLQQPALKRLLNLFVRSCPVQTVYRLAYFIQGNVAARDGLMTAFFRNKTHQHTIGGRTSTPSIFGAGWGVFEDERQPPYKGRAVVALLQEFQFIL
jgi:hypothetical protein